MISLNCSICLPTYVCCVYEDRFLTASGLADCPDSLEDTARILLFPNYRQKNEAKNPIDAFVIATHTRFAVPTCQYPSLGCHIWVSPPPFQPLFLEIGFF